MPSSDTTSTDIDPLAIDDSDHAAGTGSVDVILYGDFQCPFTGAAAAEMTEVLQQLGDDTRFVFRQFPLEKHQDAYAAALASEVAASRGKFWDMYELLFAQQGDLALADLRRLATDIGIDEAEFDAAVRDQASSARVERDLATGAAVGVTGTPTFFVNGTKHFGDHSVEIISEWIRDARGA
jgi:protein-disulfide isomerase